MSAFDNLPPGTIVELPKNAELRTLLPAPSAKHENAANELLTISLKADKLTLVEMNRAIIAILQRHYP